MHIALLYLFTVQALYAEFPATPAVQLVEWVTHATSFRSPELCVQRLQSLQIGVERRNFVCEGDKRSILCLKRGRDRYAVLVMFTDR